MCSTIYVKAEKRKSGNLFSYKKGQGEIHPPPFSLTHKVCTNLKNLRAFSFWNAQIIIASAAEEWYNESTKNIDVSRLSAYLLESFKLPLCRCCGTSRGGSGP